MSAHLSRRERQIMDILHRRGRATVAEVLSELTGEPAYSTVRAQLRVLEEKGHVRHEEEQLRYVYVPAQSHRVASRSALKHLVDTFFQGSPEQVVEALLGKDGSGVSREELDRIAELVERAARESKRLGRRSLGEGGR
jgi:BlaI family transcriptional regulator, penicillinase repressor